jgi:hypothetical protein
MQQDPSHFNRTLTPSGNHPPTCRQKTLRLSWNPEKSKIMGDTDQIGTDRKVAKIDRLSAKIRRFQLSIGDPDPVFLSIGRP